MHTFTNTFTFEYANINNTLLKQCKDIININNINNLIIIMNSNDIHMTDMPLNWQQLKKRGRGGNVMPSLRELPIGKAIEISSYGTARVYTSILNNEFKDREYSHYPKDGKYYIGRTA